jgi:hypothetical protein
MATLIRSLSTPRGSSRASALPLLALAGLLALAAVPAGAQPFGGTFSLASANPGRIEIPSSPALNPTGAITIELWNSVGSLPAGGHRRQRLRDLSVSFKP